MFVLIGKSNVAQIKRIFKVKCQIDPNAESFCPLALKTVKTYTNYS